MRKLACLTIAVLSGLSVGALAATSATITQKGRVFSSESVTIKKGEAVTFANDDSVPTTSFRPARVTSSTWDRRRPARRRT